MNGIILPIGTGIYNNSSPSIEAVEGAVACDHSIPGAIYCGNGSLWQQSSIGLATIVSTTLTKTGQPSLTTCDLYLAQLTMGTYVQKSLVLNMQQTITVTAAGNWQSANGVVPTAYLPNSFYVGAYQPLFNCVLVTGAGNITTTGYITTAGAVGIYNPASSGSVTFTSMYGLYT